MLRLLPVLLVTLLAAGCSGGDGEDSGLSASQVRALTCVRATSVDLVQLLDRLEAVLREASGDAQDGVAVTPSMDMGDPPNTFDYETVFDADHDGEDDTRLTGKITFPQDPAAGIPGGVDLPLSYRLAPTAASGPLAGSGDLALNFETGAQTRITGSGALAGSESGCDASIGFDTAEGVRVVFPETIATAPQLAAEIRGLRLFGTLGVNLTTGDDDSFVGTVDFGAFDQNATVDGNLNGAAFRYTFSIYPDGETVERLTDCVQDLADVYVDMTAVFLALSEVIDGAGGDLAAVPPTPGLTLEATSNPNVSNYAIDLTRFGVLMDGGRIDGQVRISRVGFRLAVLWSWRLNGRIGAEVVVGQSALFFRVQYGDQGNVTSVGEGSLSRDGCAGAFAIPEEDPLEQPLAGGSIRFGAGAGVHVISAEFAVGLGGAVSRRVFIDDIPAPERIVLQFGER